MVWKEVGAERSMYNDYTTANGQLGEFVLRTYLTAKIKICKIARMALTSDQVATTLKLKKQLMISMRIVSSTAVQHIECYGGLTPPQ
eukprot:3712821-Pleurochrysis_carterae.AAC.3